MNVLYPPAHHSSSVLFFLVSLLPIVFPFALTYIYNNAEQKGKGEGKEEEEEAGRPGETTLLSRNCLLLLCLRFVVLHSGCAVCVRRFPECFLDVSDC